MTRTRNAAPAPRPSNEELLDAIAKLTLLELLELRYKLILLTIRKIAEEEGL